MEMKTARLSPPEVSYALAIATQRDACKGSMRNSRLKQNMSGFGVHFAGVVGELLFRKVYGGSLNLEILPNGDCHESDITLDDGRKVEVKTSLFQGRDVEIKFEEEELGEIQWCSLVQVTLPDTGIVFPIWHIDHILFSLTEKDYGYGKRFVFKPLQT